MKINIDIGKRHLYAFAAFSLVLTSAIFAVAFGGNNPSLVGHSALELIVNSSSVVDGSITSADILDNTISDTDVAPNSLSGSDGGAGRIDENTLDCDDVTNNGGASGLCDGVDNTGATSFFCTSLTGAGVGTCSTSNTCNGGLGAPYTFATGAECSCSTQGIRSLTLSGTPNPTGPATCICENGADACSVRHFCCAIS